MSAQIIDRRYVIGMTWQQTVQAVNLKRHAQQLARKARADYYCTVAPATVGTAKLKVASRGEKLIALATGVAALGSGHVFAAIKVPQGIWICGAIDRAPATGFDLLVPDEAAAQALLVDFEQLASPSTSISVFADDTALLHPRADAQPLTLAQLISAAADSDPLAKVGTSIPLPVLYTIGGVMLMLGGIRGWDYWQLEQQRQAELLASANEVDPKSAWTQAYEAYAKQKQTHGHQALRALREATEQLPTSIAGYRLKVAECAPATARWACTLSFDRTRDVGLDPTNAEFDRLRPKDWHVEYPTMDEAKVLMHVPAQPQQLDFHAMTPLAIQQVNGISVLQRLVRAFNGYTLDTFQAESVPAPLNKNGEAVAMPAELGLAIYKAKLANLSGPLRSVDLLVSPEVPVAWTSFKVEFARVPNDWQASGDASLTKSLMTATLVGEIYAKN